MSLEPALASICNFKRVCPHISSSGQPRLDQLAWIQQAGFVHVMNLGMPEHPEALANEAQHVSALGMHYHALPVPFDAPELSHYRDFENQLSQLLPAPVWIHCLRNYRVSSFLYRFLQRHHHMPPDVARSAVFTAWQPIGPWQRFWMDDAPEWQSD